MEPSLPVAVVVSLSMGGKPPDDCDCGCLVLLLLKLVVERGLLVPPFFLTPPEKVGEPPDPKVI